MSSADQSEYTYYSRYFGTVKSPICCEGNSLIKCCCNKLEFYSSDNLPFSKTHISTIIRTLFLETADIIVGEMQKADQEKSVSTEISSVIGDSNIDSENLRRRMIIDTFVIENYAGDATYDKLALLLCLGRRQCIRVVRELTGETLGSLIKKQRMHTARQLIETGNMTLDEIANYVGYMSYSGFYTAYKNYYGISPGDL